MKKGESGPQWRHGESGTPLYNSWSNMITRTTNKNCSSYSFYGGRGITVSKEWINYIYFKRDMGATFKKDLTLDRIDNAKGYSKDNCRWATRKEQARNYRKNRLITYCGKTQSLAAWAEESGIGYSMLRARFHRGWSTGECFARPKGRWA